MDPARTQRFWLCFELEIERARRFERTFAMSRLTLGVEPDPELHGAIDDVESSLRVTDAITLGGDRVLALWSEADRDAAAVAVGRLLARLPPGTVSEVETLVFPDDGLSAAVFAERLAARLLRRRVEGG